MATPQLDRGEGWSLIVRQVRRAPRPFALGGVGTMAFALATIGSSYVIGWAVDTLLFPAAATGDVTTATQVAVVLAVLGVSAIRAAGIATRRLGAYMAQYTLQARDRVDVTNRYLQLPIEWHRRHPAGQLLSNVNADVEMAAQVASPLPMVLGVSTMLAVTAVLLVITDPYLAVVGFAVGPAIALTNLAFQRRMRVLTAQAQRLRADVSDIAHESFDSALVVKTLGREAAEVDRLGASSDQLRDRMIAVGNLRASFDPIMEALPNLGTLAVLAVGAWRVDAGAITAGTLITFAFLFRLVALPMRVFTWLLMMLPASVAGWRRVQTVLDEQANTSYGQSGAAGDGAASAEVDAVGYTYPPEEMADLGRPTREMADRDRGHPKPADSIKASGDSELGRGVDQVSLAIEPGTTVAIVGPTGSGKSTLAQLMIRLFDPDRGQIRLNRLALPAYRRQAIADQAAIVFQEAFLFDDTVAANITLGDEFSTDQITRAASLAQADGFITALPHGYDTVVGERGAALSGGQRQRIALARALIRQPRLLILDDATSAVDPSVEAAILDGLAELDTTVVIVAYRRSSILLADLVVYVEEGQVVGQGSHHHLYRTVGSYARLIDAYDPDTTEPSTDTAEKAKR